MRMIITRNNRFFNIQISSLVFTSAYRIILLFHELSNVFKIILSKLISIHRHVNIQLLYFWKYLWKFVFSFWLCYNIFSFNSSFFHTFDKIFCFLDVFWEISFLKLLNLLGKIKLDRLTVFRWIERIVDVNIQVR